MKLAVNRATTARNTDPSANTTAVEASGDTPVSRDAFFPGIFEILLPAVLSALPQIIGLFRDGPPATTADDDEDAGTHDRFAPAVLLILGPLLAQIVPVVIETLQSSWRSDDATPERMEEVLPDLLGAIVPPLVRTLRTSLPTSPLFADQPAADGGARLVNSEVSNRLLGTLLQVILPAISSVLPQLIGVIYGGAVGQGRDIGVSWTDFTKRTRLHDNDNISVRLTPIDDPDSIEIALQLGGAVSWWKGIQIVDDNDQMLEEIGAQGDTKSASVRIFADDILETGGALRFGKAKFLGVHTWMYSLETGDLEQLRGKRATFRWYAD